MSVCIAGYQYHWINHHNHVIPPNFPPSSVCQFRVFKLRSDLHRWDENDSLCWPSYPLCVTCSYDVNVCVLLLPSSSYYIHRTHLQLSDLTNHVGAVMCVMWCVCVECAGPCPTGVSWNSKPSGEDTGHEVLECSNAGKCDQKTGTCQVTSLSHTHTQTHTHVSL